MKAKILNALNSQTPRSAWGKGVRDAAIDLLTDCEPDTVITKEYLLNGAANWSEYSYGGCASIYDAQIAEQYCNPSELKRCKGGELMPNRDETWLDLQARALWQAARLILREARIQTMINK